MIYISEKFYITTAIPYVNAKPHLGHTLEFIQTDVLRRFHALKGEETFLVTGADENSLKNVQAAERLGIPTQELCDINGEKFRVLAKKIGLDYDVFRKSSSRTEHSPGVIELWNLCDKNGDIYKKKYRGLYCVGCEVFYKEEDLIKGVCPEHQTRPEEVEEENYFFRLARYQKELEELIQTDKLKIYPESRKNEVLSFIRQGLEDFSVSRSVKRAKGWGIPVPDDESQIMYVWFDALSCYITGVGYGLDNKEFNKRWPAESHVIGKGIIRFHAVYWPAMLLSAGLPLPKSLFVHGYITIEGQKMSKSLGNVLDPMELIAEYGADQLRYYLMAEVPTFADGDFSEKTLVDRINNELVANLGNLVNRTLVFIKNNFESAIYTSGCSSEVDEIFAKEQKKVIGEIKELFEKYEINEALHKIMNVSRNANKYFQDNKPWELIKTDKERTKRVLNVLANQVIDIAILVSPYLPNTSKKIFEMLKIPEKKWKDLGQEHFEKEHKIGEPAILFNKIDPKILEAKKNDIKEPSFEVTNKAAALGIKAAAAIIEVQKISNKNAALENLRKQKFRLDDSGFIDLHKKVGAEEQTSVRWLYELAEKGGRIPNINTLVDSYNFVSLKTGTSAGAHDIFKIKGNVRIDICNGTELYVELGGKNSVKIRKGEYAALDEEKVICRLELKQCEQTKVTKNTKKILLYYSGAKNHTQEQISDALVEACELIKQTCGGDYKIIYPKNLEKAITFTDLDLEVGEILEAKEHPNADKLFVEKVRLGDKEIQVVSGLVGTYFKEELIGKKIIVVKNLKPAKMRGIISEGMLLVVENEEGKFEILSPDAQIGTKIIVGNEKPSREQVNRSLLIKSEISPNPKKVIEFKEFTKVKIEAKDGKVMYNGKQLFAGKKPVESKEIKEGRIR